MPTLMKRPSACSGPSCPGCSSANCMAEGGKVKGVHRSEEDVNESDYGKPGQSVVGSDIRANYTPKGKYPLDAYQKKDNAAVLERSKDAHYKKIGELQHLKKQDRTNLAHGGEIKGVNKPSLSDPGTSEAGKKLKPAFSVGGSKWDTEAAKETHRKTLGEMKDMKGKDRTNLAEGGEIESDHDEMHEALGHELMEAFDKKDKKGVMSAIKACVMRCMNKE